mgnify:FL=1
MQFELEKLEMERKFKIGSYLSMWNLCLYSKNTEKDQLLNEMEDKLIARSQLKNVLDYSNDIVSSPQLTSKR